jgi:PKD repeat protein
MVWARAIAAAALLGAAPGCSCGDNAAGSDAAAVDGDGGRLFDASMGPDAIAPLIWIDFSITGCASGAGVALGTVDAGVDDADAGAFEPCRGDAPLALEFVPIAPASVDVYEWSFGDGSEPVGRAAPVHVYTEPGVYDVSLSAQGPGGTAGMIKPGVVVVGPAGLGAPCDGDDDCESGLCVCGDGDCAAFAGGFCSAPCGAGTPCEVGACAQLAPGSPPAPDPWQATLCLPDCEGGAACRAGSVCRELLRGDDDGWVEGCFAPGLLGDVGDACADAGGVLQDHLCAGGVCLAEGQRGACSAACDVTADCPTSAACATFEGGAPEPSCVARCDADTACDGDPWLACAAPGGTGAKDFTVDEIASDDGYCAPKPCSEPEDCGLSGSCTAGFCGP